MKNKDHHLNFNFQNTYSQLNENFYSFVEPNSIDHPKLLLLDEELLFSLNISNTPQLIDYLSGNSLTQKAIAQAYAGHQFGHFTKLGDGRAALLGEQISAAGERFDIQLKGSGTTPYSRGGDGKATLSAMLREYIYSNALHALGLKTSRSLAVIGTNEKVYRQKIEEGGLLVRVMQSHLRIGTFEYARYFLPTSAIEEITHYTVQRHYPHLYQKEGNLILNFFEEVMDNLISMVVSWYRVGFIHGVMNTDNMSLTGETFDYGPCAFMNAYDPNTTFSSIDSRGRYSFYNQRPILKWNLARFAETLFPIVDPNKDWAAEQLNLLLSKFEDKFNSKYQTMMCAKLGLPYHPSNMPLVEEFLQWLQTSKSDYTNSFLALSQDPKTLAGIHHLPAFLTIREKILNEKPNLESMSSQNPVYIPRNYLVESALEEYQKKQTLHSLSALLEVLKNPYTSNSWYLNFQNPPPDSFDEEYRTFCNT